MNIAQLKAFVTVIERGSFSEAARELGVSQPAVSMQLQALESDLGVTLLDRRYRKVDLTEAGQELLPHARRVLEELAQAEDRLAELSGTVTGRLNVAASTTPGVYVIPRVLGSFVERYPQVGLSVTVLDTAEVMDAVESGRAHIGIAGSTAPGRKVVFEPVGTDELLLIAPPGHRLAGQRPTALSELCEESWVLREPGSGTRKQSERILMDHGLDPAELRVAVELSMGEAIVNAVEGGLGIAIVSRFAARKALELGTIVELQAFGLPSVRSFSVVLPKGMVTRAARAFHEHLLDELALPGAPGASTAG